VKKLTIFVFVFFVLILASTAGTKDPYLWLEDVLGSKSLEWVKARNIESTSVLEKITGFEKTNKSILEILDSDKKIPYARKYGKYMYNFWMDANHPRGIYRRTSPEEYKKDSPSWEIVLDIDKLAKTEKENWVFKGIQLLYPNYKLGLINLSRGGSDASVVREFDVDKKEFVKDGFILPEAKSIIQWIDKDSVFVGTDFGPDSLTESGYPSIVKIWKRNTPLAKAKLILRGNKKSVYTYGTRYFSENGNFDIVVEADTFYKRTVYNLSNGKLKKLKIPSDAEIAGYFKNQLLITLKSDLRTKDGLFKQGSVIIGKKDDILSDKMNFITLVEPKERLSIASVNTTKNYIIVTVLDNVVSKLYQYSLDSNGKWEKDIVSIKKNGTLSVYNTNENSDDYFVVFESFLTPDSLYRVIGKTGKKELLKSQPEWFDSKPYKADQLEAISADGTKIPYFIIMRKDVKFDGHNPTLLYGYGGFQISLKPFYSGTIGKHWLGHGGIYVLANIRGGGEFGPKWHQSALKMNKKKSYEDFIAIAEDLIKRKITSPKKLGIQGGSNGGLLVGAVTVMRPDLFNAVVCQVPLLDMKRYTKLLAGASWAAEYGDPNKPEMWNYIKTYSPYHNVKKGIKYPEILFTTSTKDDRVHPGHARKMVAKMLDMGHKIFYYENIEGGHAGAANNKQRAYMTALSYTYLYKKLIGK